MLPRSILPLIGLLCLSNVSFIGPVGASDSTPPKRKMNRKKMRQHMSQAARNHNRNHSK